MGIQLVLQILAYSSTSGNRQCQNQAFNPLSTLNIYTKMMSIDPKCSICFSLEQYCAPTGITIITAKTE